MPRRKQQIAETISKLRKLNKAGGSQKQIETLLRELETLLKISNPPAHKKSS
jgi:hypothetical protein